MATSPAGSVPVRGKKFGRYRLLEVIGRGGMAEVYRAVAQGPGGFQRQVVLKRIRAERADSTEFVDMFVDEAKISALLEHPNIVQVYDFGECGGDYFLAMEYLRGRDLVTTMRHLRAAGRDLPIGIAAYVAAETAKGLAYAHGLSQGGQSLGIVHRDVTPSNIMLLKTGGIKLLDFGIARAAMKLRSTTPVTGLIKGKFAYLSPEQVQGQAVDGRSDVFSLGVVLWECLVGQRLFYDQNDLQTMRNILDKTVIPPSLERPGLPPVLDDVVLRALDRDPARRFATAGAMAESLTGYLLATRFSSDHVAHLLDDVFGPEAWNEDPLPDFGDTPLPPPPADLTDEAATETRLTPVPPPEDDAGYSVVSSVKPMAPLAASRRPWAALAGGTLLLVGGGVVAFHTDGRPPQARPTAPRSALPTPNGASLLPPAAAPSAPAPEPPAVSEAPQEPEPAAAAIVFEVQAAGTPRASAPRPSSRPRHPGPRTRGAPGRPHPATAEGADLDAAKEARAHGLAALASGQVQKARAALERALPSLPHDAELLGSLADAAFELGDLGGAHAYARRATTHAPRTARHHMLLGDVCLRLNRLQEAVDAYRNASTLAPHDAGLKARLQRAEAALRAEPAP